MLRFLTASLLASLVVLGLADTGPELLSFVFERFDAGVPKVGQLAWSVRLGGWLLEAAALTGLFLLVQSRRASWWLVDGVIVALVGWIFRAPLLVMTVVARTGQARDPWWTLSLHWLVAYVVCGGLIGWFGRQLLESGSRAAVPLAEPAPGFAPPSSAPSTSIPPSSAQSAPIDPYESE